MLYVKADDESILSYGEEVQRRQTVFMPLDLSTVVSGIGIKNHIIELGAMQYYAGQSNKKDGRTYPITYYCIHLSK